MAAKMSVIGLILSSYPYLRSEMVRFPRDGKTFQRASSGKICDKLLAVLLQKSVMLGFCSFWG